MADGVKQPLGIGAIFSNTFSIYFRRFIPFMLIGLIPSLVLNGISTFMMADMFRAQATGDVLALNEVFTPFYWVFMVLSLLLVFVMMGVYTLAAYDTWLGKPLAIGSYIGRTLGSIVPIIVLGIAFYVIITVGFVLLVLPGLYLIARFFVFTPAILVEGAGFGGLGRASELSKEYRWPMVLAVIALGIIIILVSLASQLVMGLVLIGTGGLAAFAVVQSIIAAIVYSISAIFTALLYARLREIKEGIGMEGLAQVFE